MDGRAPGTHHATDCKNSTKTKWTDSETIGDTRHDFGIYFHGSSVTSAYSRKRQIKRSAAK